MSSCLFFFLLLSVLFSTASSSKDLGITLGSHATSKIIQKIAHNSLHNIPRVRIGIKNAEDSWFAPFGNINSQVRISLGDVDVRFQDNLAYAETRNVRFDSTWFADLYAFPLFLDGTTFFINATIDKAVASMDVSDIKNINYDCKISMTDLDLTMEYGFVINPILRFLKHLIPTSLIQKPICSALTDRISSMRKKMDFGIPLANLVPQKFVQYLISPNVYLYPRFDSVSGKEDQLVAIVTIDWFVPPSAASQMAEPVLSPHSLPTSELKNNGQSSSLEELDDQKTDNNLVGEIVNTSKKSLNIPSELVQIWVEDNLFNEVFHQFLWDFEWLREKHSFNSSKIPNETRDFLTTLCVNCFFMFNITADGLPSIRASNSSIIIKSTNRIAFAIENPYLAQGTAFVNKTRTGIDMSLTLIVEFTPRIEKGIFRTNFNLLDKRIQIKNGSALPRTLYRQIAEMLTDTITEDIWPAVQRKLEPFMHVEGLPIPTTCGIEPSTAQLRFESNRIGVSSATNLDELSIGFCLRQLMNRLPDFSKIFAVDESEEEPLTNNSQ